MLQLKVGHRTPTSAMRSAAPGETPSEIWATAVPIEDVNKTVEAMVKRALARQFIVGPPPLGTKCTFPLERAVSFLVKSLFLKIDLGDGSVNDAR
jgi:hypothetical protein